MMETFAGTAVLTLLAVDVFVTVLHASSGAGPYTAAQNRLVWGVARAVARTVPWPRTTLSIAAPAMALATPVAWITMLTLGFALLYLPVVSTFGHAAPAGDHAWVTALYYSGYLTSTLGIGDVVPSGATWRIGSSVHSALGFGLFSAAITYVLSIYTRHTEDVAFALHVYDMRHEDGGVARDRVDPELARSWAARLATVNVAHRQYPILHYFHGDPTWSLPVQVGRLIDMLKPSAGTEVSPAHRALERALGEFMDQMPFATETAAEGVAGLQERHRALLEAHLYTP